MTADACGPGPRRSCNPAPVDRIAADLGLGEHDPIARSDLPTAQSASCGRSLSLVPLPPMLELRSRLRRGPADVPTCRYALRWLIGDPVPVDPDAADPPRRWCWRKWTTWIRGGRCARPCTTVTGWPARARWSASSTEPCSRRSGCDGTPQMSPVLVALDVRRSRTRCTRETAVKVRNLAPRPPTVAVCAPRRVLRAVGAGRGPGRDSALPDAMDGLVDYYRRVAGEHDNTTTARRCR